MTLSFVPARLPRFACAALLVLLPAASSLRADSEDGPPPGHVRKKGIDVDLRSLGRQVADDVAEHGTQVSADVTSPLPGVDVVSQIQLRGQNVQANDGALDNIQIFAGFRPFVKFTQSETSIAASGRNIVAAYNTSANQPLVQVNPTTLAFTHRFLSGFSASDDGGQTWTSGFLPPVSGSIFTFGDPVVAADRHGNFYFAGLGANAAGQFTIQTNKSTDGGKSWSDAVVVQQDNGGDKDWLAVGPDPFDRNRDNVYVTWTSFQATGSQVRFARSTDGGATWTAKTVFAPLPDPNPANPQNAVQFSNPYVDPITGRLYLPFARFSNSDVDFIQVLASDDAGETFHFLDFNAPGAPDPTLLPVVQPGELIDCRSGGRRLAIHSGADVGGRFGLRSFVQATRLTVQPTFAARNGVLYLAWSNSTSPIFGDPNSGSNVMFVRSDDGGGTWSTPIPVNPSVAGDAHHVLPSLAIDQDPNDVHVTYYTQHADGTVDLDMANSHDRGDSFPANRTVRVSSTSAPLTPSNIRLTANTSTNYDRTIVACYCLGEYQGLGTANGMVYTAWGDTRNMVTEPVNALDPLSGQTHAQTDVFFQKVKAQ
ncbi:MAG TPA: sialidase family protein [Gemmatimonadales bacterium]|nr:sialidase family protein [Gemmatimonadales bacterium]